MKDLNNYHRKIKSPIKSGGVFFIPFAMLRGAVQTFFWVNLAFCPNEGGGGSRQSQLFIKIAQNLICLGTVHKCDETHST